MPINNGETLLEFEARLKREATPAKRPETMTADEQSAAVAALERAAVPRLPQLPAHLADKRVEVMTLDERRLCARILNINPNYI